LVAAAADYTGIHKQAVERCAINQHRKKAEASFYATSILESVAFFSSSSKHFRTRFIVK